MWGCPHLVLSEVSVTFTTEHPSAGETTWGTGGSGRRGATPDSLRREVSAAYATRRLAELVSVRYEVGLRPGWRKAECHAAPRCKTRLVVIASLVHHYGTRPPFVNARDPRALEVRTKMRGEYSTAPTVFKRDFCAVAVPASGPACVTRVRFCERRRSILSRCGSAPAGQRECAW